MAEIVGLIASVLQLVDTVAKACGYITDFHNAPREQQRLLQEIQSLEPLIKELDRRILNAQDARSTSGLQAFAEPLIQLEGLMERLSKKMNSDGASRVSNRLTWSLWGKEDVQKGLITIERFKSLLTAWLGMELWDSTQDILCTLEERRIDQNYIARSVRDVARNQEQYHDAAEREKIIEWFSPLNFFLRQADIFSTRQPGTGEWLLKDELFKEWKLGSAKTVWCRGMPGAGKTVLASMVVNHLRASLESRSVGVAVVYLNHQETESQSLPNLLAGLWRQLVVRKPISLTVSGLYEKHREQRTRPSLAEVDFILCSAISEMSNVFIVVDAVDEYPEQQRHALLRHLSALTAGSTVNLMLTSRPHLNLIHVVRNLQTLEIRATEDDIRRHVDAEILKSPRLSRHIDNRPQLREEIEESIVLRSDGMFLLAKLHMDSLTTKHTIKAVRDALSNMPGNLNSTYDEVVERINRQSEDDKKLAWCTLSWVTNAKRPLRPSELREALAVEPGATDLDSDNLLDIDMILSVCAGLVVINQADKRLRLIHYTTQNYLDHVQSRIFPHAPMEITTTCITYLSFDTFRENLHDPMYLFHRYSLLDYAVEYCLIHARGQPELHIQQPILAFLADCDPWWTLWNWKHSYGKRSKTATRLWIAASFHLAEICRSLVPQEGDGTLVYEAAVDGLADIVRILMENGTGVDTTSTAPEAEYDSALHAAAARGHVDIIHILLDHGVDIDLTGTAGTALQMAALAGQKQSVRVLILRGANINIRAGPGTPLIAASVGKNYEIVQILLEHGAKVNAAGRIYGSALHAASSEGSTAAIVRLLIQHGADVNTHPGLGSIALHAAVMGGHNEIARLLIEHGADVDAKDWQDCSPLQAALHKKNDEIAGWLIEHGADVNVKGGFAPPLYIASRRGSFELVRLLLEHGAKVDMKEKLQFGALHVAVRNGHKEIARLLVAHGADVNQKDALGCSALHAAIDTEDEGIAKLLLENGADANTKGIPGTTLYIAARRGRYGVVRLLLEHGAEVDATGDGFPTALHTALVKGEIEIARLLIQHGANVNQKDKDNESPLHTAMYFGGEASARLLIENGADVNAKGGSGTALYIASRRGSSQLVRLLLEHGAKANGIGEEFPTALHAALMEGHDEITHLLMDHGADSDALYHAALFYGYEKAARLLLDNHGADANARAGQEDRSVLQAATSLGHEKIVQLLLEHGADANEMGRDGAALHIAAHDGWIQIAHLLLEHGADIDAPAPRGLGTALHIALCNGHREIVSLLIKHGAEVNAMGGQSYNAVHGAASHGHKEIALLLIQHGGACNSALQQHLESPVLGSDGTDE
ncbi:ankyrin repeat-containing domain protein [Mycena rosella]|uniref:Ankyrin repeat-containing domain protein n=1 Tax=Mycena rosella TaxID=1033263 RepID=A0AAD7M9B3_MYCRO|nr:ankyrin repeat-containing domain protein [Mycena rosella]